MRRHTTAILGPAPSAADFFFSPGRSFFAGFMAWAPAGGRHRIVYATCTAKTTGTELHMVVIGSSTRAPNLA